MPEQQQAKFKIGDRVVHASRPEWGAGHVARVSEEIQDGRPAQRLTIRFERAGVKTISTAFADLRPAAEAPAVAEAPPEQTPPVDRGDPTEVMTSIPEPARDPFAATLDRLAATLSLYRFSREGAPLLDWAASQSGLRDPLTRFSRHDLEILYDRFRRRLDEHLAQLVVEVKREVGTRISNEELQRVIVGAPEPGREALKRASRSR